MIQNICRGLCVLNVLIGIYLILGSIGSSSTPGVEKSLVFVMFGLLWAMLFFVATFGLFFMLQWSRRFMIGLYGTCAFFTAVSFGLLVAEKDPLYTNLSGAVFSIYLIIFAIFMAPVVFMLHRDVKSFFNQLQEDQQVKEEKAARATFKRPDEQ